MDDSNELNEVRKSFQIPVNHVFEDDTQNNDRLMSWIFHEWIQRSKDPREEMKMLVKKLGFRLNKQIDAWDQHAYEKIKKYT